MQRSRRLLIISLRYSESLRNAAESRESHWVEGDIILGRGSGLGAKFWAVFFGFGCCWGESDVGRLFPIETWTEISSALRLSSVYGEVQGGRRALRAGAVLLYRRHSF